MRQDYHDGKSAAGRRWLICPDLDASDSHLDQIGMSRSLEFDEGFLNPKIRDTVPDPMSLHDMDRVVDRLHRGVVSGEKIGVFGDYDVDGACSTAIMVSVLRDLGSNVEFHIPDRVTEGYGPNVPALAALAKSGCSLIVCLDCGTAAHKVFTEFREKYPSVEILVVDHHKSDVVVDVEGVVNPNGPFCGSGLTGLCATGLVFIVLIGLRRALLNDGKEFGVDLMAVLDLVALATVCDVMPLIGVNRTFARQGVRVMSARRRPGLAALLDAGGAKAPYSSETCGFVIGPRINAGGRIGDASLGVRLLLESDETECRRLASSLHETNSKRQSVEKGVLEGLVSEARKMRSEGERIIVFANPDWHQGVVGIVAGRIKEEINRPVFVAGGAKQGDGDDGLAILKGSARSVPGFDVGSLVIEARERGILLSGGGHSMAAGFSLLPEKLEEFRAYLNENAEMMDTYPLTPDVLIDVCASGPVHVSDVMKVGSLEPFGTGFEKPVFLFRDVELTEAKLVGKENNTLKFTVKVTPTNFLKGVCFKVDIKRFPRVLLDSIGKKLDMVCSFSINEWNGNVNVDAMLIDFVLK